MAVYFAVHVLPDVFVYVTVSSVIASPPDWKVTVGVAIVSFAVNVNVTISPTLAKVVVELFDAILTLLNVGAVVSTTLTVLVTVVALFPLASSTL